MIGPGVLTLAASDGYSGGTTVNGGTLLWATPTPWAAARYVLAGGILDLGTFSPATAEPYLTSGTLTARQRRRQCRGNQEHRRHGVSQWRQSARRRQLDSSTANCCRVRPSLSAAFRSPAAPLAGSTLTVTGASPIDAENGVIRPTWRAAGLDKTTANTFSSRAIIVTRVARPLKAACCNWAAMRHCRAPAA